MAQFLPHLFGQHTIKNELQKSLEKNRIPHTMIFYGDEGLGKTTAALDLASVMLGEPNNIWASFHDWMGDPSFSKLPVLTAADDRLWYLRPTGMELKIEQFLFFLEAMAAFDSQPHVCIIDEAQTMGRPVANSMLKTLEEPPAAVYFILITHDIDALLPTIVSRAEKFAFFPLSEVDFQDFCQRTDQSMDQEGMDLMYQLTEGNPGILIKLADAKGDNQPEAAMDFWEMIISGEAPFSEGTREWKSRDDFLIMLRWVTMVGRDILLESGAPGSGFGRCKSISDRVRQAALHWDEEKMEQAIGVLTTAQQAARRYISPKTIWDMIILRLCRIRKGTI